MAGVSGGKNWNEPRAKPPKRSEGRLLNRIVLLDFKKPFDLIPEYKRSYEKEIFAHERALALSCPSKTPPSMIWSQLLNAVRTYFENLITEV